jgi:hypothetical protein
MEHLVCRTEIQPPSPLWASRLGIDPRKAPGDGARDLHQDEITLDSLQGAPQAGPGRITLLAQLHLTDTEAGDVTNQP